ncbi:MAG: cadherin domain-containing protein [Pseudomonadota bacterium]
MSFEYTIDDGAPGGVNQLTFTKSIDVTLLNDAPSFSFSDIVAPIQVDRNEDSGANAVAGWTVSFVDNDDNEVQFVSDYIVQLVNPADAALFLVQPDIDNTGQLTFTPALNANGLVPVSVQVQDTGAFTPPNVNTSVAQIFNINIVAVNDPPVVTPAGPFAVAEDAANATAVGTPLTATDVDSVVATNWQITAGNTGGAFAINPATGQITVANSAVLDFDTAPVSYNLTVTVDDDLGATSAGQVIVVNLTNVNEAPTVTPATRSIQENSVNGTNVGAVLAATDPDAGSAFTNWQIVSGNGTGGGAFAINAGTGQITVADSAQLNFEETQSFTLGVTVQDNGVPPITSASGSITVNITDDNGEVSTVTVNSPGADAVAENTSATFYTATATGGVGGITPFNPYNFTLDSALGGVDSGLFTITGSTGAIRFTTPPNFEAPSDVGGNNVYNLTVRATDNDGNFGQLAVVVTVTDVTESNPVTVTSGATDSVLENTAATFYLVTATGGSGPLTFSIDGGVDAGLFNIDGSGNIAFNTPPNFEVPTDNGGNNVYNIIVKAEDNDDNEDTQTVAITVTDDSGESFTPLDITSGSSDNVDENTSLPFHTITASGGVEGGYTFSISGTDAGDFSVNSSTGEISFNPAPNFEAPTDANTDNVYLINVSAEDDDQNSVTEAFTVTVDDVGESATVTVTDPGVQAVPENTGGPGDSFLTVSASGGVGGGFTFSISGGVDSGDFAINGSTGELTFSPTAPDFEVPTDSDLNNQYLITVRAVDGDGNDDTQNLIINVTDTASRNAALGGDDPLAGSCWDTPQSTVLSASLAQEGEDSPLQLFTLVSNAQHGAVVITDSQTGDFNYIPYSWGARGADTFDYLYDDGAGNTETRRGTVVVHQAIMPLGDSITAGVLDGALGLPAADQQTGYRLPLQNALAAAGYFTDMVGSVEVGDAINDFDANAEAHSDWSAYELAWGRNGVGGIYSWLDANPSDFLLIHTGSYQLSGSAAAVGDLLDEVDRWETSVGGNPVQVMLAKIVDQSPTHPDISAFNAALDALVANRPQDQVTLVDINQALVYPADIGDGFHPTGLGYDEMAASWMASLEDHDTLAVCPSTGE